MTKPAKPSKTANRKASTKSEPTPTESVQTAAPETTDTTDTAAADDIAESPSIDHALVAELRTRWPAPGKNARAAYLSQWTDAACEELGTKTRGERVLNEAAAWALKMDEKLRDKSQAELIAYSGARLIFFVDLIDSLDAALSANAQLQGTVRGKKNAAGDAERVAENINVALHAALARVAGERKNEKRDLADASTAVVTPDDLAQRIKNLSKLGAKWLDSKDSQIQILSSDAKLTPALLAAAAKARTDLSNARSGARTARLDSRDPPAVNRAEGRIVQEMKYQRAAVEDARRTDKGITPLVPGPATREVILGRSKPKASKKGAGDSSPPTDAPTETKKAPKS